MTENSKGWTPERRAACRDRILKNRPWEKSTGPKTRSGKRRSALNAFKNGKYSQGDKFLRRFMIEQACLMRDVDRAYEIIHKNKLRNELMHKRW